MKTLIALIFFLPIHLFAQDITGIWTGFITTSEKKLPYEIVISDNNGKLNGYSHTTFNVNGKEIVSVKKVKVENDAGSVLIDDDDLIYNDFKVKPPKKVRQFNTLSLKTENSVMVLVGTFITNKTKELKPASGDIRLEKKDTSTKTKIIPKLEEMNLLSSLSFLQPKIAEKEIVAVAPPVEAPIPPPSKGIEIASAPVDIKSNSTSAPLNKKANAISVPVKATDTLQAAPPKLVEVAKAIPPPVDKKPVTIAPPKPKPVAVALPAPIKKLPPAPPKEKPVVAVAKPQPVIAKPAPVIAKPKQTVAVAPDIDFSKRKIETIQGLTFKSDSLTLTLYDNGEVDGDTVSVIMNGKVIISRQGLSTNAFTKTIYITPDLGDSVQLIMYAENLGSIPPNTGLLILQDGDIRHEIRFAGDLTKNAAITLKRQR